MELKFGVKERGKFGVKERGKFGVKERGKFGVKERGVFLVEVSAERNEKNLISKNKINIVT
jgi:hypothetical protein